MQQTTRLFVSIVLLSLSLLMTTTSFAEQRYYGRYLCDYAGFKCVKVGKDSTWESLFPNQREREVVMRLNRTNMPVKYRSWIVVPTHLRQINAMELSPFPLHRDTHGQKLIYVNLTQQAFGAYDEKGSLEYWGPVSGGKGYCPDIGRACHTATGEFKIYRKQGKECKSSRFPIETQGGAPMPYCMHFNGGFALHGSTLPGYNASHGCVRLFPEDAKWLNQNFTSLGTQVIVAR